MALENILSGFCFVLLQSAGNTPATPFVVFGVLFLLVVFGGVVSYLSMSRKYFKLKDQADDSEKSLKQYKVKLVRRSQRQRKLDQKHKQVRRMLKLTMLGGDACYWRLNLATQRLRWSKNVENLLGADEATLKQLGYADANTFVDNLHPEDQEPFQQWIEKAIAEKGNYTGYFRLRRPSGEYFWVRSAGQVNKKGGKVVGMEGVMIDVSREKQAEEDLRRSDVFFKLALETASIAVFTQDDALRYTWVFDKLMGFNNAAVLGKTDLELGLDEAAVEESARFKRRVMQTGRQQTLDLDIPHPNGRLMSIRIVAEPYTLPNGEKGIIGASFDETGLKQAHRDLEQTANRLTLERVAADEATRAFRRQLNLRSQDMDDARILQLAMLPEVGSLLPEWDTFFHMETSQEVGGDYYDLYQRRTGELVVAVGDATGHGAKASIMVSAVKAFFQSLVPNVEPRIALEKISTGLQNMNLRNMFMGLTLLELHPDLSFKLSVAGMPPTLIYRAATGQVDQLHMRSLFLGTPLHKGFEQIDDRLQMGDVILLISDGMVETQDGDGRMMGFNTIVDLLKKLGTGTADEIGKGLIAHQAEIQGIRLLKDDTTLVVIKPGPGLAPSA